MSEKYRRQALAASTVCFGKGPGPAVYAASWRWQCSRSRVVAFSAETVLMPWRMLCRWVGLELKIHGGPIGKRTIFIFRG